MTGLGVGQERNLDSERVARLEAEIERLRDEHAAMQQTVDAMRSILVRRLQKDSSAERKLAGRLAQLEGTVNDTAVLLKAMVTSRIWKTLQALGGLALRMMPQPEAPRTASARRLSDIEKKQHVQMRCDTVSSESLEPFSGKIQLEGWATSKDGVASVEIQVAGSPPLAVTYGLARPDLESIFPNSPEAKRSGFKAELDTTKLPDGLHKLNIRAVSRTGKTQSLDLPLAISQESYIFSEYNRWLEIFETRDPDLIRIQNTALRYRPLVSVLVPVYKTGIEILRQTVDSVKRQSYPNWELCIADDGSDSPALTALLQGEAALEPRIHVLTRPVRGGIAAASNDALAMAKGEYIALLDHDDLLVEDALFYMVNELQTDAPPDLLYSDEDHIDEKGRRFSPFFKPDWSPDLILSENYVCHLMIFRRDLLQSVGGFRGEFDLSQDHDVLLRMSANAKRIVHVPRVLYHWRTELNSMTRASLAEDKAFASSRGVVQSFVAGRGTVEEGLYKGRWRVRYPLPAETRVSILIPSAGKIEILDRNLTALWKTAGYDNYEVVIIDNSKGDSLIQFTDELRKQNRPVRRFDQRGQPFNYSRLNNLAAATCDSELLLFLNDDTEGILNGWLTAMAELAMRPEVGAVGAKLLYPDGTIQHGGVTMGLAEICGHSFKGLEGKSRHYYDFPDLIRNVSAVTAACVMMRANVFRDVGGFDEERFPIAYNDIDLTLKIGAAGYRVLYTPHAQLYHYEAFSKSDAELHPHPAETLALKSKWKEIIAQDPFYNPNLTRHVENWSLRWD
jgi:GT2 family glycosyltransferase